MAKKPHYVREWRKDRGLTLEQLAERIGMSHQNLGKIERFIVPYSQPFMERVAEELRTEVASLIMRNPADKNAPWSIWETLSPVERGTFLRLVEAIRGDKVSRGEK